MASIVFPSAPRLEAGLWAEPAATARGMQGAGKQSSAFAFAFGTQLLLQAIEYLHMYLACMGAANVGVRSLVS